MASWTIDLPPRLRVDIAVGAGDVTVDGVAGGIVVSSSAGPGPGDAVELEGAERNSIRLRATVGDIAVRLGGGP